MYIESCQTHRTINYLLDFSAVRTVAEGHRMVEEGWHLFEEAVAPVGAGDLPQLLHSVCSMTTPPPAPTPPAATMTTPITMPTQATAMDVMTPGTSGAAATSPIKNEGDEPVVVLVGV